MMHKHYPELLKDTPDDACAAEIAGRVWELTDFLLNVCHIKLEDLGEYIVQLADETPSHIIMPAIHKNTDEISILLHEKTGTDLSHDVNYLAASGRPGPPQRPALSSCRRPVF